jgi:hypothetical protein
VHSTTLDDPPGPRQPDLLACLAEEIRLERGNAGSYFGGRGGEAFGGEGGAAAVKSSLIAAIDPITPAPS